MPALHELQTAFLRAMLGSDESQLLARLSETEPVITSQVKASQGL